MTKLLLSAFAMLSIAGPALADGVRATDEAPTKALSTRGVDFNNRDEVRHFYARLRGAAQAVCDSGSANPRFSQTDARCVSQVMAAAVKATDKPVLTALYQSAQDNNRALAGNDQ
jgi:UrcA family protein